MSLFAVAGAFVLVWRVHKAMHSANGYEQAFWLLFGFNCLVVLAWVFSVIEEVSP